ncbi:MAG: CDF family Co(II)/Ni(II) efflux transporter DmeF [Bdellovibrionales bacterium]|nr:CDF family Co(II)/Ni(II) efflux transporter DmeF [Bdellovibrionales bacterium]
MAHNNHKHDHNYLLDDEIIAHNEKRTFFVVILTSVMMVIEIIAGHMTSSMALLADGWHMASHAGALTISLVAYKLAKSGRLNQKFSFGAGKFIPLGGYTSAIALALIAILMGFASGERLFSPVPIKFNEAILVAVVGLIVNIICALLLTDKHHHHEHSHSSHTHDHNLKSAYVHVVADALTSVFAIIALTLGKYYQAVWLDPVMGIVGACVILRWAYLLCKETAWELLGGHAKSIDQNQIRELIESHGAEVSDLHIWRVAPNAHACELVIFSSKKKGTDHYRNLIDGEFKFSHLIVEERLCIH